MDKLANLASIIDQHGQELKKPGVVSVRPGYQMKDGWPTQTPAIVVTVSKDAGAIGLPQEVGGVPIDVRNATPIEELRFQDPQQAQALAERRPEFRGGAFSSELDPVASAAGAAPALAPAGEEDEDRGGKPQLQYTGPDGVKLQPVTGTFPLTCHASPDAGWPTLKDFLAGTETSLTVSMYDFTSKHVLDGVTSSLQKGQSFELTLDHPAKNPTADQTDPETIDDLNNAIGDKFESTWALVRTNKDVEKWIFPNAYHIKVAVRDSSATWLSSGNWNNSNQPDIDPINNPQSDDQAVARKSDRDWHVIMESPEISAQFEAFMKHDFEVASAEQVRGEPTPEVEIPEELRGQSAATFQFHAPLRIDNEEISVTPLLTPDQGVYTGKMLELIQSAEHKLYIQLQYIHPPKEGVDQDFMGLIDAVVGKINDGLDVRIILSQYQLDSGWLDRLQSAGVDLSKVKIQNGVHNKGFLIDSSKAVVSSQNWSGDGVLRNRDAGVIVESETVAKYFETIFVHDWTRIARQSVIQ